MKKDIIVFKLSEFPHVSETFIFNQIRTAIELGYDVQVLISKLLCKDKHAQSQIIEDYNLMEKLIFEDYKIPKNKVKRVLRWLILYLKNLNDLKKILGFHRLKSKFSLSWLFVYVFYQNFNHVKIIHVQYGTNQGHLAELKAIGFNPKIICSFHGHDAFFPINRFITHNNYYSGMFKYFDRIVANTPFLQKQLLSIGCPPEKLRQIPVSIDSNKFKPSKNKIKNSVFTLISVGRLEKSKGQINILRALKELINSGLNIKLNIVGSGNEFNYLLNYTESNQLLDYVHFMGSRTPAEIVELLNNSDLFVFTPITLENGWGESQGLVITEAMSCELPVICFNTGGVKYTFENDKSGFLISEGNIEELILKVKWCYHNPRIMVEMGIAARNFVLKNYSNDKIENIWKSEYDFFV